jgi:4'-phosphopantetheinyl transferase
MPFQSQILSEQGKIGLWRIDGTEEDTYDRLFGRTDEKVHPRTSLQRKASRLLLDGMLGFPPELEKAEDGRPLLRNSPLNVSISHTDGLAAVMLGDGPVSVDVQAVSPRIMKLRERYLKPGELSMASDMETATLLWAAKETV